MSRALSQLPLTASFTWNDMTRKHQQFGDVQPMLVAAAVAKKKHFVEGDGTAAAAAAQLTTAKDLDFRGVSVRAARMIADATAVVFIRRIRTTTWMGGFVREGLQG